MTVQVLKIVRSKRRTIALHITEQGELIVRAPKSALDKEIEILVKKHNKWIIKKQEEVKIRKEIVKKRQFNDGEIFYYLGNPFVLKIKRDELFPLTLVNNTFILSECYKQNARELFFDWYKQKAAHVLTSRVHHFANLMKEEYSKIGITNAKTRWGSCSANNNLNFSWHIIMAPLEVIDYLVIHELSHIKHKNHKKRFWAKVEKYCPSYKDHNCWLRKNQHILTF